MKKIYIIFLLCACGPSKEDITLSQAAAVHKEAIKNGHRASMLVAQLKNREATLSQAESDTLLAIIQDLSSWYDSIAEVPGFMHDEHDHSGHDHTNKKNYLEGLSAEEVLVYQVEMKKEMDWLESRVINLLNHKLL